MYHDCLQVCHCPDQEPLPTSPDTKLREETSAAGGTNKSDTLTEKCTICLSEFEDSEDVR